MDILTGILIPFVGTTAGSACVFFLRGELKPGVQKAFLGFASGVMVAASVWSLLIPAMEMSEDVYKRQMVPCSKAFRRSTASGTTWIRTVAWQLNQ